MTWKIKGKIGCHFPDRTGLNPNFDVARIVYSQDGIEANAKEIEKVYYISPAAATAIAAQTTQEARMAELAKWLVWQKYWEEAKQLAAGSEDVAIEYFNTLSDVTVHHIGIFTADAPASTSQCIKIIHESGTVLAQIDADSVSAQTTKYGLQGYLRTAAVNNIVFHKNQKYYIQYTDNRSTSEYHPAYFENETGNYKAFKNRDSKSVANLNDCAPYLGWISNLDDFIDSDENTIMVWNGDSTLNTGTVYIRNGSYHDTYTGKIGNNENLSQTLLDQILKLDSGSIFLWGGYNFAPGGTNILIMNQLHQKNSTYSKNSYKGIISNRNELLDPAYSVGDYGIVGTTIWRKKNDIEVDDTMNFDDYSGLQVPAAVLIQKSYNADGNKSVMTYGSYGGSQKNGYIYTLKSGFSYDFTIDQNEQLHGYTISNPPSSWVINRIYYLEEQGNYPGATWAPVGLNYYYEDSQGNPKFGQVSVYNDTLADIFNIDTQSALNATEEISLGPTIDNIGQITNLIKASYTGNYISNDCRNTTVSNTAKYYLEINGNEV